MLSCDLVVALGQWAVGGFAYSWMESIGLEMDSFAYVLGVSMLWGDTISQNNRKRNADPLIKTLPVSTSGVMTQAQEGAYVPTSTTR